jgi:hypothetical protein
MRSSSPKRYPSDGDRDSRLVDPLTDCPEPSEDVDEGSELDDCDLHRTDDDDARWDVFIPDDDERDPLPDPGDFGGSRELGARSMEPD